MSFVNGLSKNAVISSGDVPVPHGNSIGDIGDVISFTPIVATVIVCEHVLVIPFWSVTKYVLSITLSIPVSHDPCVTTSVVDTDTDPQLSDGTEAS